MTEPSVPPAAAIFVNEDLSKGENRTNLALLAVLMVPQFRYWFLGRLGFPPSCVIYPPQTTAHGLRPDLVAVTPDGQVHGWIEIELGGENTAQMEAYRAAFGPQPVKCIVGAPEQGSDLSLEELALHLASALQDQLDPQQRRNVQVFIDLVAQLKSVGQTATYANPNDAVRTAVLVAAIQSILGERLTFGVPPLKPGQIQVSTMSQKAWTLRAYCKGPMEASVSLMWNPNISRGTVRVPSREKLMAYFQPAAVEEYAAFWRVRLGADIAVLSYAQSVGVEEESVLGHIAELAARVLGFVAPA